MGMLHARGVFFITHPPMLCQVFGLLQLIRFPPEVALSVAGLHQIPKTLRVCGFSPIECCRIATPAGERDIVTQRVLQPPFGDLSRGTLSTLSSCTFGALSDRLLIRQGHKSPAPFLGCSRIRSLPAAAAGSGRSCRYSAAVL